MTLHFLLGNNKVELACARLCFSITNTFSVNYKLELLYAIRLMVVASAY